MAVTVSSLQTKYPEFTNADSDLIQACIDDAELLIDRPLFAGKADMAVTALAAHLIAINPLGEMARMESDGMTTYLQFYERIKRTIGVGYRVI